MNKVLREFQSRLPRENGTRPARRNENGRGLSGAGVPRRALCSQHGAGGKSSWDLGSRGVLAHPHASCSGYSLSPASGTLSPRGWSAGRSRSCRTTLLTCPDRGRRRCGQPGKGLMSLAPGCRSGCSTSLPGSSWSKERVSSTAAGNPSLCRGLLSSYTVENEETKPPRVMCAWFLLLGITCFPAASSPLPSSSSFPEHSSCSSTNSFPPGSDPGHTAAHGAQET